MANGKEQSTQENHASETPPIATLMTWPRTSLPINDENIIASPDTGRTKNLARMPYSLPLFHGQVILYGTLVSADISLFRLLNQVNSLHVRCRNRSIITNDSFRHLTNLHSLRLSAPLSTITDEAFHRLAKLKSLSVNRFRGVADEAFRHLTNLQSLYMNRCRQAAITDKAFVHLKKLHRLKMIAYRQTTITDEAFGHLKILKTLAMDQCDQLTITDKAFVHFTNLKNSKYGTM